MVPAKFPLLVLFIPFIDHIPQELPEDGNSLWYNIILYKNEFHLHHRSFRSTYYSCVIFVSPKFFQV